MLCASRRRRDPSKCSFGCEDKPLCLKYMTHPAVVERVWQNYTGVGRALKGRAEHAGWLAGLAVLCLAGPGCCVLPANAASVLLPSTRRFFLQQQRSQPTPASPGLACRGAVPAVFAFVRNPWSRAISSFHFNNKRVVAERCRESFEAFAEAPSATAAVCLDK